MLEIDDFVITVIGRGNLILNVIFVKMIHYVIIVLELQIKVEKQYAENIGMTGHVTQEIAQI